MSSRLLNGGEHLTTEHTVVRSDKLKRKLLNSNLAGHLVIIATLAFSYPSRIERYAKRRSFHACRTRRALQRLWPWQLWLRDAVAAFLGTIITRWPINRWRTFLWQRRCLEVASRLHHVGVVDETRRTYRHHGRQRDAPRRIATFHHATLRVATHRYATLEPLGKPGGSRAFSADGLPQAPVAQRLKPKRSDNEGAS